MDQHGRVTVLDAGSHRRRDDAPGIAALLAALGLVVLPAILALTDSDVLSVQHDGGWLGSPITRFATLQSIGMLVPLVLGALATRRERGREFGSMAVVVALLGNFLLLRAVLALVVTTVLL